MTSLCLSVAIFGQTLTETMAYEARTSNRKVPRIIEMCVEFLLKNGVEAEGIFRFILVFTFFHVKDFCSVCRPMHSVL